MATISGTLLDTSGKPIAGARIEVFKPDGLTRASTSISFGKPVSSIFLTNIDGTYGPVTTGDSSNIVRAFASYYVFLDGTDITAPVCTADAFSSGGGPDRAEIEPSEINVSQFDSLNSAVTAVYPGSTVKLVVTSPTPLKSSLAVPSNISLDVRPRGMILAQNTAMLAINGPFSAGLSRVFSGFNAGDVTFGAGSVTEVYPEWWGATAGAVNTSAIQSAINSLSQGLVVIGDGTFYAINLTAKNNVNIVGKSKASILKVPDGTAIGNAMLTFNGVSNSSLARLTIDGNAPNVPGSPSNGSGYISVYNSNNILISSNTLTNNDYIAISIAHDSYNITVDRNVITNTDVGIETLDDAAHPSHDLSFTNNIITGGTSEGISLFSTPTVYNVLIAGNNIQQKTTGSGIHLKNVSNFIVSKNLIKGNASGIALVGTVSDGEISQNKINANTTEAIFNTSGGTYNTVAINNNQIYGPHRSGILLNYAVTNFQINNNLIGYTTGGANWPSILINNGINYQVAVNRLYDDQGSPTSVMGIYLLGASSINNLISQNHITDMTSRAIWIGSSVVNTRLSGNTGLVFDQGTNTTLFGAEGAGVLANAGDADYTFTSDVSVAPRIIIYDTPITATRTVNLPGVSISINGRVIRITRTANCTGAFNVNVGGLKNLTAAGQWAEVSCNGSAWVLTAYGSL